MTPFAWDSDSPCFSGVLCVVRRLARLARFWRDSISARTGTVVPCPRERTRPYAPVRQVPGSTSASEPCTARHSATRKSSRSPSHTKAPIVYHTIRGRTSAKLVVISGWAHLSFSPIRFTWDLETTKTTFKNNIILRAHLEHSESWQFEDRQMGAGE